MPYVLVNYKYLFPKMLKNNPFFLVGVNFQKIQTNTQLLLKIAFLSLAEAEILIKESKCHMY